MIPQKSSTSARKPICVECGPERSEANVIRLQGTWVCRVHLKVRNTRYAAPKYNIIMPTGVEDPRGDMREFIPLQEILPNRAARHAMKKNRKR